MDTFKGFPAGELRFTAVPDLFFARLLPQIDSLAELKVTLHFLWVHYRQARQVISFNELLTDETLVQSLALLNEDVELALMQGLNRAVERTQRLRMKPAGTVFTTLTVSGDARPMLKFRPAK